MSITPTNTAATTSGAGYGTQYNLRTFNGLNASSPSVKNPSIGPNLFQPRQAQLTGACSSNAIATAQLTAATVIDGGLLQAIPYPVVDSNLTTAATTIVSGITLGLGASPSDLTVLQPF